MLYVIYITYRIIICIMYILVLYIIKLTFTFFYLLCKYKYPKRIFFDILFIQIPRKITQIFKKCHNLCI